MRTATSLSCVGVVPYHAYTRLPVMRTDKRGEVSLPISLFTFFFGFSVPNVKPAIEGQNIEDDVE